MRDPIQQPVLAEEPGAILTDEHVAHERPGLGKQIGQDPDGRHEPEQERAEPEPQCGKCRPTVGYPGGDNRGSQCGEPYGSLAQHRTSDAAVETEE